MCWLEEFKICIGRMCLQYVLIGLICNDKMFWHCVLLSAAHIATLAACLLVAGDSEIEGCGCRPSGPTNAYCRPLPGGLLWLGAGWN